MTNQQDNVNKALLEEQLAILYKEHKNLDQKIIEKLEDKTISLATIQNLKKQKLSIKDKITLIESKLLPNSIA
jgi:hypothetical protein